jgi:hypothetical protein
MDGAIMSVLKPTDTEPFARIGPIAIFGSAILTTFFFRSFFAFSAALIFLGSIPGKTNPIFLFRMNPLAFNLFFSFTESTFATFFAFSASLAAASPGLRSTSGSASGTSGSVELEASD